MHPIHVYVFYNCPNFSYQFRASKKSGELSKDGNLSYGVNISQYKSKGEHEIQGYSYTYTIIICSH